MAHFAELDQNNIVTQVIVINNSDVLDLPFPESEPVGVAFCQSLFGPDTAWRQTSYNGNFRRQYAEAGGFYYPATDVFVDAQPFPSWVFQSSDGTWQPPIPMPVAPNNYVAVWDEEYLEWDIVFNPESGI